MALSRSLPLLGGAGAGAVGHPEVALLIHEDAVGREQHPGAEALHQGPGRIELEDRIIVRPGAAVGTAALGHPDAPSVPVDLHRAGGAPGPPFGEPSPAFDGPVGIGSLIDGTADRLRRDGNQRRQGEQRPEKPAHWGTPG